MGCSDSRPNLSKSQEETYIQRAEAALGYSKLATEELVLAVQEKNLAKTLLPTQLIEISNRLGIQMEGFESEVTALCRFYKNFLVESRYCSRKLVTLGILCGKGSVLQKAEFLFKNYDLDLSNTISQHELEAVIQEVLDIALEYIVNFALQTETSAGLLLKKHSEKLLKVKPLLLKYYRWILNSDKKAEITYEGFMELFAKGTRSVRGLVDSSVLREVAVEKYIAVIASAPLVKTYIDSYLEE